jgi:hypothetical protein
MSETKISYEGLDIFYGVLIEKVTEDIINEGIDWDTEEAKREKIKEILNAFADWVYKEM